MGKTDGWDGFREFRVQKKVFEDLNRDVCSLYLVPTDGGGLPTFKPGQFLTFRFHMDGPVTGQSRDLIRCYSLSDQPGLGYYRVSVKRVPAPTGSVGVPPGLASNHIHDVVREGACLPVKAPSGHFFLEEGESPVVLVAGGIGITPMLSMLNAHFAHGPSREVWLFYGLRNSAEQVGKAVLETWSREHPRFHLQVCHSRPLPGDLHGRDFQHAGHVDIALLRRTISLQQYRFYLCGPRAMMESLIPALDAEGVPEESIHFESFGPATLVRPVRRSTSSPETAILPRAGHDVTVTFSKSGKRLPWDEQAGSLLDFAEANGVDVASWCRAGECGTCETSIQEGEVTYAHSPDFEPESGHCLLCISKPKGNLSLDV